MSRDGPTKATLSFGQANDADSSSAPDGVDIIHDEHESGRKEREGDGASARDVARENGEAGRERENSELELDDPPLVLQLELRLVGVADNVGGRL